MLRQTNVILDNSVWPIWWKLNFGETKIRPVHVSGVVSRLYIGFKFDGWGIICR